MADSEIRITYETLYELLRRERSRDTLQELNKTFLADIVEYIKGKIKILNESQNKADLFSLSERDKVQQQLNNVKKIITELYDRRQKKILNMAVNKSIVNSDAIDTSGLLETEQKLYKQLLSILSDHRKGVLYKVLQADTGFSVSEPHPSAEEKKQDPSPQAQASNIISETKMLRFLKNVPRFVGMNGEPFGPFEEEDIANIPAALSHVLIAKGKAEEIEHKHS